MTREEAKIVLECMATDMIGAMAGMRETMPMLDVLRQRVDAINIALTALRPVSREQLSEFKTCDLVDELRKREGVETHIAEPYQDVAVSVNGPAVVLVVID